MNLLVVDDEYYSVEWIAHTLEASGLPLTILCAYSMEEAQEVFSSHHVDIMISDIEMPKGSGLELLEWIRGRGYQTICLFLTSFATFDYASQAIKLQSSDYLLKPISREDLLAVVEKAMDKWQSLQLQRLHAEYWADSQTQNVEAFWARVALEKVTPNAQSIAQELKKRHLPASTAQARRLPVLLRCLHTEKSRGWDRHLYEYGVKNILMETLFRPGEDPIISVTQENHFLVLRCPRPDRTASQDDDEIKMALRSCADSLPGIFHFFPARTACCAEELSCVYRFLWVQAQEVIFDDNMIFYGKSNAKICVPKPPWREWHELLRSKKSGRVLQEAKAYLTDLKRNPQLSRKDLIVFQHDFLQMVYSLLERLNSMAHDLFCDGKSVVLSQEACGSVDAMQLWVEHVVSAFDSYLMELSGTSDAMRLVKQYIDEHLAEDLTRNSLAELVFLSPDYLSHLFAKKEGMSITDYIHTKRIQLAKELLLSGRYHISDIALKSGFQNISYFSKQFKRHVGQTPNEFRKSNLK